MGRVGIFFVTVTVIVAVLGLMAWVSAHRDSPKPSRPVPVPPSARPNTTRQISTSSSSRSAMIWTPSTESPPTTEEAVRESARCWVSPGSTVVVAGLELPGGMLYVGSKLRRLRTTYGSGVDPALIDPSLRVDRARPDHEGATMDYWPSYSTVSEAARAAYLEWLAGGRREPGVSIGYVFLHFYGLERRLLLDGLHSPEARAELPLITTEVERLLGIYGGNASFRGYASSWLDACRLLRRSVDALELEPPRGREGFEVPLRVKLALGSLVASGLPIPADWALAWLMTAPETHLRTPAQRCPEEFRELFALRYRTQFRPGGLLIKPNKTRLSATYQPASSCFGGSVALAVPDLPDVTALSAPLGKLRALAERATQELDAYSRWVGRTDDRNGPAALALLPPDLAAKRESPEATKLVDWIEGQLAGRDQVVITAGDLVSLWPGAERFARRDAEMLGTFLAARGFGIEPDVRSGGSSLAQVGKVVLFRRAGPDAGPEQPEVFAAATLLLHLAASLTVADGSVSESEQAHLEAHLERALQLPAGLRLRLRAHLAWLVAEEPGLAGIKKRIEPLSTERRQGLATFLLGVAAADGRVDHKEIKLLEKIYPWLGLPEERVYSDLHALASSSPPSEEPVTVRPGERSGGYALPGVPPVAKPGGAIQLDTARVTAMLEKTREVGDLLSRIFAEDEAPVAGMAAAPLQPFADGPRLPGLDATHSAFLAELLRSPCWPRVEIERLAERFQLLPDGALELINEAALEAKGAALLEGEDPVELDPDIAREISS